MIALLALSIAAADAHAGFFLRPEAGIGVLATSLPQHGSDALQGGGAAAVFGISIGGAVAPRHLLAIHLWVMDAPDPAFTIGSEAVGPGGALLYYGFGPEYTYYFKNEYYLSITPSLAGGQQSGDAYGRFEMDLGFAARAALGKEWRAGPHWGLGIAAQVMIGFNGDSGTSSTWTTWQAGISFTASCN